jgi:hypothetical protein
MLGVSLDYYDIAYGSCNASPSLESALGYRRIFLSNKDVKIIDAVYRKEAIEGSITLNSSDDKDILAVIKANPSAIVFKDLHINKKVMERMKESDIALCLPASFITCSYGLQRSRNIYLMSRLFAHAKSIKLDVSFATLAMNNMHLCSYIQLMELAKLLGSDEEYARKSLSKINNSLVRK